MGGAPAQTLFQLPYLSCLERGYPYLCLERGVHKLSPAEHLAPFYRDPAQRIAVFFTPCPFVFQVEALARLAEGREGCKIGWNEWKKHVTTPSIRQLDHPAHAWISGCRLFCVDRERDGPNFKLEMYDFSRRGRTEYFSEQAGSYLGGVRYLSSTGTSVRLPWLRGLIDENGGCDSVVIFRVSVPHVSLATRLNDGLRVVGQVKANVPEPEGVLHIWKF